MYGVRHRPKGSSPLARGLPRARTAEVRRRRIIPARAGFTHPRLRPGPRPWDHPRSRGVYRRAIGEYGLWLGSSPLARGLRGCLGGQGGVLGIIPARAGFTRQSAGPAAGPGDHPRSRGVYWNDADLYPQGGGSSPLARGLRTGRKTTMNPTRIIPARAGFTRRRTARGPGHGDHPRSRGVYVHGCVLIGA